MMECFINIYSEKDPKTPIYFNNNCCGKVNDDYGYIYDDVDYVLYMCVDESNILYDYVMYVMYVNLVEVNNIDRKKYLVLLDIYTNFPFNIPNNIVYLRTDTNIKKNNSNKVQYYINYGIGPHKIYLQYLTSTRIREIDYNSHTISNYLRHIKVYCADSYVLDMSAYGNNSDLDMRIERFVRKYYNFVKNIPYIVEIHVSGEGDYAFLD